jgi:hypothetical protein
MEALTFREVVVSHRHQKSRFAEILEFCTPILS